MKKATKKQMVDFLHTYMRLKDGKRPTKKLLNAQSYEKLEEIINNNDDGREMFRRYLVSMEMDAKTEKSTPEKIMVGKDGYIPLAEPSEEKAKMLAELVDDFVKEPYDFFAATNLRRFLENLPHGSVEQKTLDALAEKAKTAEGNEWIAVELSLYAIVQSAYAENNENVRKMREGD